MLGAYPKLISALNDLRVSQDHTREVIDIVRPYLKPARQWLNVDERFVGETADVGFREREQENDVHVHDFDVNDVDRVRG